MFVVIKQGFFPNRLNRTSSPLKARRGLLKNKCRAFQRILFFSLFPNCPRKFRHFLLQLSFLRFQASSGLKMKDDLIRPRLTLLLCLGLLNWKQTYQQRLRFVKKKKLDPFTNRNIFLINICHFDEYACKFVENRREEKLVLISTIIQVLVSMSTLKIVGMRTHFSMNLVDESAKGPKKKETLRHQLIFLDE